MDSPPEAVDARPRFPVDFPLSLSIADLTGSPFEAAPGDLLHTMEDNGEQSPAIQVQVQIDGSDAAAVMRGPVPVYPDTAQSLSQPDLQMPVKHSPRRGKGETVEHKPIVTLKTVLEPTTYTEKEEDQSRSLGYIGAQRAVLRFLDKYAADQLQPKCARDFTQSIDTKTEYPSWKDALRFCYWMRSQGFDTYAQIKPKKKTLKLFIADPITHNRAADKLYWEQNTETGDIQDYSDHHQRPSRRNAVSATGSMLPAGGLPSLRGGLPRDLGSILGQLPELSSQDLLRSITDGQARIQTNLAHGEHAEHEDEMEEGYQEAPAVQPSAAATERTRRLTELVTLQEQLEHILNTGDPDEARLAQLFDRIEALRQQIDGS